VTAPLKVFVTADPELPVPPRFYGGIERVIAMLVEGLVDRGHTVTLFAHAESVVPCELVAYRGRKSASLMDGITQAATIARETLRRRPDVIHSFGRLASLLPVLPLAVPKIMTYQRSVTPSSIARGVRLGRRTLHFTGCSRRLIAPVQHLGDWRVVYNGVPIDRYQYAAEVADDAPLVFLGRIEHIKGVHVAIDVARRAGRRLIIAGSVPDEDAHREYFRALVQPLIDGRHVDYVGPVDDAAKSDLLSRAAALLMPVLWEEPFGIVMAEAMACGTPVIGLARGAVPEVVDDGATGFVCHDADQMVAAVARIRETSRPACREAAERRFSARAVVDAYELLYREIQPAIAAPAAVSTRASVKNSKVSAG
jgi:glycosyltransferase involved in cell wall biosynthesis